MATQPPAVPANYGTFKINPKTYVRVGPLIHEVAAQQDTNNNYMGIFLVHASKSTNWEPINPFLTTIIITTAATQPGTPQPPPPPPAPQKKILAEKLGQFKGDHKEYKWWKKSLDMYLQAARDILQDSEDKILFTYSLMQEGEVYHFVRYYKDQMRLPTNQWD